MRPLKIVIFGLSITSSWGNGHATTFRSLVKALHARGHQITFVEKDVPWYATNRDMPNPPFCRTLLYRDVGELKRYAADISAADLVILGSYVADAQAITRLVKILAPTCFAFYDIDTPVTLAKLEVGDYEYLHPDMIPLFDIYWSFTGGPTLQTLEQEFGAQRALPLYCSVDPDLYYHEPVAGDDRGHRHYVMGYLGTYSDDRQPTVNKLLIETARRLPQGRFCVAGAQYPAAIEWPANVRTVEHIPPERHRSFYNDQLFTLNVTRRDMIRAGYSPSVRLFEAGACGTPVISDYWPGLDNFFSLGDEILVARNCNDVLEYLAMDEEERLALGLRFRQRILDGHTSRHRALEIEHHWQQITVSSMAVNT
jgi:spore maturation protein CgeB